MNVSKSAAVFLPWKMGKTKFVNIGWDVDEGQV